MRPTDLKRIFKKIRATNHITQAAMADSLGINQSLLSLYENGRKNIPEFIINRIISLYNLDKTNADYLKSRRITLSNKKAIETLERLEDILVNYGRGRNWTTSQLLSLTKSLKIELEE